jgi:hypothetical protein
LSFSFLFFVFARYAAGFETAYPDGFPFLVTSEESLAELNQRINHDNQRKTKGAAEKTDTNTMTTTTTTTTTTTKTIPMNRFRSNVVVNGVPEAWDEDKWLSLKIVNSGKSKSGSSKEDGGGGDGDEKGVRDEGGVVHMKVVKPCGRCKMPTVNQATGIMPSGFEPIPTTSSSPTAEEAASASSSSFSSGSGNSEGSAVKAWGKYTEPEPTRTLKVATTMNRRLCVCVDNDDDDDRSSTACLVLFVGCL